MVRSCGGESPPPATPPPNELTTSVLAEVRAEQVRRWRDGERPSAETLLAKHPELAADPEAALVLIYGEILLREEVDGTPPNPAEYAARFPDYATALGRQLELHGTLTPLSSPDLPGFEIIRELGRGGAGVVYLAREVALDRLVAVKVLLSGEFASAEARQRFRREAEAAAALRHPNIVPVHAIGEHHGRPFLVLEYIAGGSLDRATGGTPMPARRAAALVRQLADAVGHAHAAGIVHRDLKPANVLLASRERERPEAAHESSPPVADAPDTPKIADFGLAKRLDLADGPTATSQVLGTPSYMAPEQAAAAKEVGPAADIYALGAILYDCLTGRPPFKAASLLETLAHVTGREPAAPRSLNPAVPRDLETICLKCLSREPTRRYASAAALADDLGRFLDGRPVLARPVGWIGRAWRLAKRKPAVASLAAALAVLLPAALAITTTLYVQADRQRRVADEQRQLADDRYREGLQFRVEMVKQMSNSAYSLTNLITKDAEALAAHRACVAEFGRLAEAGIDPRWCRIRQASHMSMAARALQQLQRGPEAVRAGEEAVAACAASLAEWPDAPGSRFSWQMARHHLATALYTDGQFEKAAAQFDELIPEGLREYGPCVERDQRRRVWMRDMYANRAFCRFVLKRFAEAVTDFEEATRRDRGERTGYYAASRAHSLIRLGKVREGLDALRAPLGDQHPSGGTLHEAFIACSYAADRPELSAAEQEAAAAEAVKCLRRWMADRPESLDVVRARLRRELKFVPALVQNRADFQALLAGQQVPPK
jgi:tetratricopeptide (TPR) repeat protein